jgi:hypothetical protein
MHGQSSPILPFLGIEKKAGDRWLSGYCPEMGVGEAPRNLKGISQD